MDMNESIKEFMEHKRKMEKQIHVKKCPKCGCEDIGIDNWDVFKGKNDLFYYCKECDYTFL